MDITSERVAIRSVNIADAAKMLVHSDRVLVIGCSGGGKSTLSQKLGRRFALDYISIDRDVLWLPGWIQRDKEDQLARTRRLIAGNRWVMDGTNTSTFDIRVPRSDLVIWVRMPRYLNVWGILSRWARHRGETRPEMAVGCPEKVDWEFFRFVWTWEAVFAPRVIAALQQTAGDKPVLVLTSRRQTRELLDLVGA
ncbi:Adenylate kinase [Rhizobium sp. NFR07]|nr:Adenylate kinase [Rhizobium sp. NFR07]